MPEVISDIVVSAARLFHSPIGTAAPLDTLDVDADWPEGWVSVGYTLEPVKASYTFDVLDVMVQQEMGTVKRIRIKEALKLSTVLAELTAATMALSFAGEVTTAAATSTLAGYEEFSVGGKYELPMAQWGLEGSFVDEDEILRPIRVFVWKATAAAGGGREVWKGSRPPRHPSLANKERFHHGTERSRSSFAVPTGHPGWPEIRYPPTADLAGPHLAAGC